MNRINGRPGLRFFGAHILVPIAHRVLIQRTIVCETRIVVKSAAYGRLDTSNKFSSAAVRSLRGTRLAKRGFMLSDDHVTVQEAAEYLRISISTVYRLLRAGKLTAVKVKVPGAKGGLRVSRRLVFEFSDGHSKAASLEQTPPPIYER